jgi:protein-S-isoprenylcysteine O-methyltransferase Ste14
MSTASIAASALLTGVGTLAELFILAWLGRSFSLLPEARALVMRGPYRTIRHPLYLSGLVIALGAMLQFKQPWALFLVLFTFALQIARMRYEEQVLGRAFPDYADYKARSWRLVPGLY